RGVLGAAGAPDVGVRRALARVGPRARGGGRRGGGGAGEREDAVPGERCEGGVAWQWNGKRRSGWSVPRDASETPVVAAAMADETTVRFVGDKAVRKQIYVPNRLLNLVVG